MDIDEAKKQIMNILANVQQDHLENVLQWSKNTVIDMLETQFSKANTDIMLDHIREDIRKSLPLEAVTSTETIIHPKVGPNADCDPSCTVHVDGFLYDDDTIDDLCEEGIFSRNFCLQCGSRNVKPLTFVSHSSSVPQIKFIFQHLLGDLRGKTVLDVGSRTGALLYGAYLYSMAAKIVGVEIDKTFCDLQNYIVDKYKFSDRVMVINGDIRNQAGLLHQSDVIVLNNVFEFFMPLDVQQQMWEFLFKTIRRKDTILITVPSVEVSLFTIGSSLDVDSWLSKVYIQDQTEAATTKLFSRAEDSDLLDIHMYTVL